VMWMRDERGFSSSTIVQWRSKIRDFLQWYERNGRPFCALEPIDVDAYFVTEGARRWSRVSTSGIAAAIRVFFCVPHPAGILIHIAPESVSIMLGLKPVQKIIPGM
jgi:site-specific recombinase XerD